MNEPNSFSARYAALEALLRLESSHVAVKSLFETVADKCRLDSHDRNLAMNILYGVLRNREYLELLLARLSRHPLKKLDQTVRQALLIGLYQIFFLTRIPESAAVNETVNACRAAHLPKHLIGFINCILRTALRQRHTFPATTEPLANGLPPLNHPSWLVERWQHNFGKDEMLRICTANNEERYIVLRANTSRISRSSLQRLMLSHDIAAGLGHYAPDAIFLPDYRGSITTLPGYEEGLFQVQDEAAQLSILLLGPIAEKGFYLDACAGLGGKTGHIRQLAEEISVEAVEPEQQRQRLFRENMNRLFNENLPRLFAGDLLEYHRVCRYHFDRILVDAPCSGTGVCGRNPDIRWNRQPEDLLRYQQQQLDLLQLAADLLVPGGILVYATCSLEPEENQTVIEQFLHRHTAFAVEDCAPFLPAAAQCFVENSFFCPRPHSTIDGFFAARLKKQK